MYSGKKVGAVVPAYNEQSRIASVIRGMPSLVDVIYVVDDGSTDSTAAVVEKVGDSRVRLLRHARNRGVGAAVTTGYRNIIRDGLDVGGGARWR